HAVTGILDRLQAAATAVVHEMAADVQERVAVTEIGDDVAIPDLVEQGLGRHVVSFRPQPTTARGRKEKPQRDSVPSPRSGEVSPSYGDGGVMSIIAVAHDPSARCAGTSLRGFREGEAHDLYCCCCCSWPQPFFSAS